MWKAFALISYWDRRYIINSSKILKNVGMHTHWELYVLQSLEHPVYDENINIIHLSQHVHKLTCVY